jgi:hypothetical protein
MPLCGIAKAQFNNAVFYFKFRLSRLKKYKSRFQLWHCGSPQEDLRLLFSSKNGQYIFWPEFCNIFV